MSATFQSPREIERLCAQEEKFTVPSEVQEQLDAYAARFFVLKTPRKLLWRPDLGAVNLTLTVGEEILDLTVTPVQAVILMQFRVRLTVTCRREGALREMSCLAA